MNSVPSPPHWVASRVIQSRNWVVVRGDYKSDGIWGLSSIATPAILLISWLPVFQAIVLCPGNMTVRDDSVDTYGRERCTWINYLSLVLQQEYVRSLRVQGLYHISLVLNSG